MSEEASRSAGARPLEDDQRQLRLLVEGVTDYAIYMLDAEGRIRSWNAGGNRIKGYTASEVIGHHFRMFYTDDDIDAGVPDRNLSIARDEGRYAGEGWRRRKDGTRFWASVVIDSIYDNGQFIGFAKITRDITERYEAQRSLEHAQQAMIASQRMEAVGKLTLGIAHDFNNLLSIIINALDLARMRAGGDTRLASLMDTAQRAADRGALLTRQLLSFARAQTLSPNLCSLSELISRSADLYRRACGPSTSCHLSLVDGLPLVNVDETQLEAAVLNLIVNASDAMASGGVIEIRTGVSLDRPPSLTDVAEQEYAYIEVADTGQGMPPDVLNRAAEPFFTTKDVGKGSGLGLSQVYGFLAQSGGFVRINSEVAVGTTVRLSFPVVE
ncbi:MAG TPA: PAS domain S-box protein [Stenotrophomonas sp.]|nr:PAS domain S-box protein [Stenotrophomonas sp.]